MFEGSLEDGVRAEEKAGAGGGVGGVFYAEGLEAFGSGELEEVAGGAADVEDAGRGSEGAGARWWGDDLRGMAGDGAG